MFSCKPWTSTKFLRSELTAETLASLKHGQIIKFHLPKRNVTPLFWADLTLDWYEDVMVCLLLLLFRTNDKKGHLDENDFRPCYGNLSRKWHCQLGSQLGSKSFLNKYEAHCQQHFERYPTVLYFTNMDQHAC